ncbi:MAG: hypothetical protein JW969_14485 [Spirochaetales bacterium]|nr:hypothetical protein [Spirochaetales bacterium]
MDSFTFGVTMFIVGMGGTLLSLFFLSLIMGLIKIIFPYRESKEKGGKA